MAAHVDSEVGQVWESEEIPKEDLLYMRVHKTRRRQGIIGPSAFEAKGLDGKPDGNLSTDWCKYSTPEDTRNRAKVPADNFVVALQVSDVESIGRLVVRHTPDTRSGNRAHTDIVDVNSHLGIQKELRDTCRIVLDLDD